MLCAKIGQQPPEMQARTALAPEPVEETSGENAPILVAPLGFFSERAEVLTNAMSCSCCCSPAVLRSTVDVDRNLARLGGFFLVASRLSVAVISASSVV